MLKDIPAARGAVESARPASGPAWPWDWMRNVIRSSLKHVLADRTPPLGGSPSSMRPFGTSSRPVSSTPRRRHPRQGILARDPPNRSSSEMSRSTCRPETVLREQAGRPRCDAGPGRPRSRLSPTRARTAGTTREDIFRPALDAYAGPAEGLSSADAAVPTAALLPVVARGVVSITSPEIAGRSSRRGRARATKWISRLRASEPRRRHVRGPQQRLDPHQVAAS